MNVNFQMKGGFYMELADGIDIAAYAMSNAQTSIMQAVSTEMLSKAMDMMEIQSAQLTQMMELSVNPGLGGNMDIRI